MATRVYMVLDKATAAGYNARPSSDSPMLQHALVAAWTDANGGIEKLDNVVAWGYNAANLQAVADGRNANLFNLKQSILKTLIREDAKDVPAGEPPPDADAPKKRGRPRKVVDSDSVSE